MCLPLRQDRSRRFGIAGRCVYIFWRCGSRLTFPTCPSLLLRGRSVFQHSAGYSLCVAQVSHSSVLPQELRVDLKLGVFENGRYLIGNMRISNGCGTHSISAECASRNFTVLLQLFGGFEKTCGQSLSIGSFPFLAAGLCYCENIALQANLLSEN